MPAGLMALWAGATGLPRAARSLGSGLLARDRLRALCLDVGAPAGAVAAPAGASARRQRPRPQPVGDASGPPAVGREDEAETVRARLGPSVTVVQPLSEPKPAMTLVAAARRGGDWSAPRASTDLSTVERALIQCNNQSWRNLHLPVVACLSGRSLFRLRLHRVIRARRDRLSLTAPPLILLLHGGRRPGLVATLARLALPGDVGRALHLESLEAIVVRRLARAGVSFVALSAPGLAHAARSDHSRLRETLVELHEAGIQVIGLGIDDSVVLAELRALGVTLGEGQAVSAQPPRPPRSAPVDWAAGRRRGAVRFATAAQGDQPAAEVLGQAAAG